MASQIGEVPPFEQIVLLSSTPDGGFGSSSLNEVNKQREGASRGNVLIWRRGSASAVTQCSMPRA